MWYNAFWGGTVGYISYSKLVDRLREAGVTFYTVRKWGDLGQATMSAIMSGRSSKAEGRKHGTSINTETIAVLCSRLKCQPGDLLEYVEDDQTDCNSERGEPNA
ncbi:hypothetical protein AGMMS49992_22470 [Clostridia bacterium]|nr:hypothetical protein AGMMS49992_22470 [Clostridia bacterium]